MSNVIGFHASANRSVLAIGNPLAILKAVARRYKNRRELNYLLSFPDYQLRDIGLQRADIEREALKPLWGGR